MSFDTRADREASAARASVRGVNPVLRLVDLKQEAKTRRRAGAALAAAVFAAIVAVSVWLVPGGGAHDRSVGPAESAIPTVDPAVLGVATEFLNAIGSSDADQGISYLADGADFGSLIEAVGPRSPEGTTAELRRLLSFQKAVGYKQLLHACIATGGSATEVHLRCPFDFGYLRSDEMGIGPFSGSHFELAVRDGKVVRAFEYLEISEFSQHVWEPFGFWLSATHPNDVAAMYIDESMTGARLTDDSIALWEQRTQEYVASSSAYTTRANAICGEATLRAREASGGVNGPYYTMQWGAILNEAVTTLRSLPPPASARTQYEAAYALIEQLADSMVAGQTSVDLLHQVEELSELGLQKCSLFGPR